MGEVYNEVIQSARNNQAFKMCYGFDESDAKNSIFDYVNWLDDQYKLLKESVEDGEDNDLLLLGMARNDSFQLQLRERVSSGGLGPYQQYFSDISRMEDMPENLRYSLFETYGEWLLFMLGRVEIAAAESYLQNQLLQDDREKLMAEIDAARATIAKAREIRDEYRKAKSKKKDVKTEVREYFGIAKSRFRTISTDKLKKKLGKKIDELRTEEEELRPYRKDSEKKKEKYREIEDELEKLTDWVTALNEARDYKTHSKKRDHEFHRLARKSKKKMNKANRTHRNLFSSRMRHVRDEVRGAQRGYSREIEETRDELDEVVDELAEVGMRIHHLEGLIEDFETHVEAIPEPFRSAKVVELKRDLASAKERYTELRQREVALLRKEEFMNAKLAAITATVEHQLSEEERLEKKRLAMKREMESLNRLEKLPKAINVAVSFFNMSFSTLFMIGNLAAGKMGGIKPLVESTGSGSLTEKGKEKSIGRALASAGLAKGTAKAEGYDTGSLSLSLKLGVNYGPDFGGECFSAKAGLAIVYEAALNVMDWRQLMAVSTIKVVASAQASAEAHIPGFDKKMTLFKASVTADLFAAKTAYSFTDQYHWAAWLTQKWANIAAKAFAFDTLYADNRYSIPSEDELDLIREIAEDALKNKPQLKNVMKDIAWFMEEEVFRHESMAFMTGGQAAVECLNGLAGAEVSVNRFIDVDTYRYKRTKDRERKIVHDDETGYPVELKAVTRQSSASLKTESRALGYIQLLGEWWKGWGAGLWLNVEIHYNGANVWDYLRNNVSVIEEFADGIDEWVEDMGDNIINPVEDQEDQLDQALSNLEPRLAAVMAPATSYTSTSLQAMYTAFTDWEAHLMKILKKAKDWFELGFMRVDLGDQDSKFVRVYRRKVSRNKKSNERQLLSIPTGVPGLNVDFGIDYKMKRTYKEKPTPYTFAYMKLVYEGLMRRRKFEGGYTIEYPTKLAMFIFNTLVSLPSVADANDLLIMPEGGRHDFACGEQLWKDYTNEDGVRQAIWKMALYIARAEGQKRDGWKISKPSSNSQPSSFQLGGHRGGQGGSSGGWQRARPTGTGSTSPEVPEEELNDDIEWLYKELKYDISQGVAGAEDFLITCRNLTSRLATVKDKEGNSLQPGTKEWAKRVAKILPYIDEEKKKNKKKNKKNPYKLIAENNFKNVLKAFNEYMKGARQYVINHEDLDWRRVQPSQQLKRLQELSRQLVGDKYRDYSSYVNEVRYLQDRYGISRRKAKKYLDRNDSFEEAEEEIKKKQKKKKKGLFG